MTSRQVVHATVCEFGSSRNITIKGQTAKALLALVEAGPKGVTAFEAATWAYRLAAYCHDLRRKHGLSIRTERESHPGGWHGRHVLESDVHIEENRAEGEAA